MSQAFTLPVERQKPGLLHVCICSPVFKSLWIGVAVLTVAVEVAPIPQMPVGLFYCYCAVKLVCFVALGYFAALAFQRFNAVNRCILLASVSAMCVEALQGILHHGHSFHWYELMIKLASILLGFALALDARYEQMISIGPIHIRLVARDLCKPSHLCR